MLKSICIEMLLTHVDFYDRFKLAKEAGFNAIEFWGWQGKDLPRIKALTEQYGLAITSFSGDADYSLCDDTHTGKYIAYAEESMKHAQFLNCPVCVIHSNALGEGGVVVNHYASADPAHLYANMLRALMLLKPIAEKYKITLALEALNTHVDHVGNALYNTYDAAHLIRLVNSPCIKVLYDIYHMQIMHGNILQTIDDCADTFGHIHIADVPGRHEPGTGEINYPAVFAKLRASAYKGPVAFELSAATTFDAAAKAMIAL